VRERDLSWFQLEKYLRRDDRVVPPREVLEGGWL
jgi:hypothetical protein